jgi:hypothetical protein
MLDSLTQIFSAVPSWLQALSTIVAAASAVTALTPTPDDDKVVGKIYRVLDFLALNIGHAKEVSPNRSETP